MTDLESYIREQMCDIPSGKRERIIARIVRKITEMMDENTCPKCEQQIPQNVTLWMSEGKKRGYLDYWRDKIIKNEV